MITALGDSVGTPDALGFRRGRSRPAPGAERGDSVVCRLDVSPEPGRAVVRIQGGLAGVAVRELERLCEDASDPLVLDVTHLLSADDAGIATLKRMWNGGAQLTGVSPYLALLLDQDKV